MGTKVILRVGDASGSLRLKTVTWCWDRLEMWLQPSYLILIATQPVMFCSSQTRDALNWLEAKNHLWCGSVPKLDGSGSHVSAWPYEDMLATNKKSSFYIPRLGVLKNTTQEITRNASLSEFVYFVSREAITGTQRTSFANFRSKHMVTPRARHHSSITRKHLWSTSKFCESEWA